MKRAVDFKADAARLTPDHLAAGAYGDGGPLDEAQVDQVLVQVDFAVLLLVELLEAAELGVRALLDGVGELEGEVSVDLVAHVLREHGRKLFDRLLELTVLLRLQLELVVADLELLVLDLESEFFLVDVGFHEQIKSHVGEGEASGAPLLDHDARLRLKPLLELEDH